MFRLFKSTILALSFSLFFISCVHAQGIPGVGSPLTITTIPENPKPNEVVTISVQSFNFDLNQATITWSVDGKVIAKGVGLQSTTVTAGKLGSIKKITISAVSTKGGTFSKSINIRPSELAILWETNNYTPPFYKGKALQVNEGNFKVVALPEMVDINGKKIDQNKLVYTWKLNDKIITESSGYGKNVLLGSQKSFVQEEDEVWVDVTYPTENISISGRVNIFPVAPETLIYEKSPLYGTIFEKELGENLFLKNEEVTLTIEPFFFSSNKKTDPYLAYSWTLNGDQPANFQNKSSLVLRKASIGSGTAEIGITTRHVLKLLQGAGKNITINYD